MIKRTTIILYVTLVTWAHPYEDLDDLGARISATVRQKLAPLQNLGPKINAEVENGLRPLRTRNFYSGFDTSRQFYGPGFEDLGSQIASNVQAGLAPLNNLGQQIEQSVNQGLQPVKAMGIISSMKGGIGGTTIATHSPSGRQFVFKNGNAYQCYGQISSFGQCQGKLDLFTVKNSNDYCFVRTSFSTVNDYICIGATSVQIINDNVRCTNFNNDPVLVMKKDKFNEMCKNLSQQVEYKYIADTNDPAHVKIPNENQYVHCSNNEPNICIFTESSIVNGGTYIYN